VKESGLNERADTNDTIVLYPQATAPPASLTNPEGCWDWWGYTGADYALQSGPQMQALIAMIHHLSGGSSDGGAAVEPDAGPAGHEDAGTDSGMLPLMTDAGAAQDAGTGGTPPAGRGCGLGGGPWPAWGILVVRLLRRQRMDRDTSD
jgi:hypothetical protein